MPKFKVFAERTETLCAIIEADSAEEAEELADENYSYYSWYDIDNLSTEILFGKTEEEDDE